MKEARRRASARSAVGMVAAALIATALLGFAPAASASASGRIRAVVSVHTTRGTRIVVSVLSAERVPANERPRRVSVRGARTTFKLARVLGASAAAANLGTWRTGVLKGSAALRALALRGKSVTVLLTVAHGSIALHSTVAPPTGAGTAGRGRPGGGATGSHTSPPPRVATDAATAITGSAATLVGTVAPNGGATTYWFEYGPSASYGAFTAAQAAGSGNGGLSVSTRVLGLGPVAAYHFRVVATHCNGCAAGTAYGADATFTTGGYQNAVYTAAAAADPFVLDNGDVHADYWAFTTGDLFPVLHSTDLVHWASTGTAMTARPAWVVRSGDWHPWAPNVVNVSGSCPGTSSASCYFMYYVGLSAEFSANCVAVATAISPGGPYVDQGPLSNGALDAAGRPIGCGDANGYGVIDPSLFIDPKDGHPYLYVSEDFACAPAGSSCTAANSTLKPTISVIPLSADLRHAAGGRTPLFSGQAGTWEATAVAAPTVEGPTVMLHNGTYYLLYSGGSWRATYGMGYATAPDATGPFTKSPSNPILAQGSTVLSPGGGDTPVVGPNGGTWLVYHGRDGSLSNPRTLRIDPFAWRADAPAPDVPVIAGPTSTAQMTEP